MTIVRTETHIRRLLMDHIETLGLNDEEQVEVLTDLVPSIAGVIVRTLATPARRTEKTPEDDDEMVNDLIDTVINDLDSKSPWVALGTNDNTTVCVDYFTDLCEAYDFACVLTGKTIGDASVLINTMNQDREKNLAVSGDSYYSSIINTTQLGIRFTLHGLNYRMTFPIKSTFDFVYS